MAQHPINLPARITGGNNTPITARWANEVREAIARLAKRKPPLPSAGGGGGAPACPFGKIISWTEGEGEEAEEKTGLNGGAMYCGDQNWNIEHHEFEVGADGVWLVSIPVQVEVNRDDENEILLPGVKTGTKPEDTDWVLTEWEDETTNYPANTPPTVADGLGTIHIPIGKLTLEDGSFTLARVDCGNIRIGHCASVLSHERE